jgi:hypothetical protein
MNCPYGHELACAMNCPCGHELACAMNCLRHEKQGNSIHDSREQPFPKQRKSIYDKIRDFFAVIAYTACGRTKIR